MKLFAVSDPHGHAGLLKAALREAGYEPENEAQLLIVCGDCFDRGTENLEMLRFLERIDRKILVKGNHEERLEEILETGRLREHDLINGTLQTIQELFGKYAVLDLHTPVDFSGRTGTVRRLTELLAQMRDSYETENYIFVHGWLPIAGGRVLQNWRNASPQQWTQSRRTAWSAGRRMPGNSEGKTIVCGHFPTPGPEPYYGDGFIAIDAGTDFRKQVHVLILDDKLLGNS